MKNLIFVHVPKCAGTSVTIGLKSVYGKHLFVDRSWRRYRGKSQRWQWHSRLPFDDSEIVFPKPDVRCVAGHFTHVKYSFLGWPKFVFLREPYARVVSHYSVRGHRAVVSFEDFVRSGENSISRMVGDLRQYFFVGLQEHYEESMKMLEWYAGIKILNIHRNFRRVPVYEPTEGEGSLYRKLNGQDFDLYKEAKKIFNRQRSEYGAKKTNHKESS